MGFTMASCSAYITMKGVMIPGVSAGSNHVGANEMCTPQVSCPSGPAARGEPGAPTIRARTVRVRARACRRVVSVRLAPYLCFPRKKIVDSAGTDPTCMVAMAFPLRSRTENARNVSTPLSDRHGVALHAQRTAFFLALGGAKEAPPSDFPVYRIGFLVPSSSLRHEAPEYIGHGQQGVFGHLRHSRHCKDRRTNNAHGGPARQCLAAGPGGQPAGVRRHVRAARAAVTVRAH